MSLAKKFELKYKAFYKFLVNWNNKKLYQFFIVLCALAWFADFSLRYILRIPFIGSFLLFGGAVFFVLLPFLALLSWFIWLFFSLWEMIKKDKVTGQILETKMQGAFDYQTFSARLLTSLLALVLLFLDLPGYLSMRLDFLILLPSREKAVQEIRAEKLASLASVLASQKIKLPIEYQATTSYGEVEIEFLDSNDQSLRNASIFFPIFVGVFDKSGFVYTPINTAPRADQDFNCELIYSEKIRDYWFYIVCD